MSNLWDSMAKKVQGTPFVLWVMFLAMVGLVIGLIMFVEDTTSSRKGFELMEQVFGVKPVNYEISYWAISLAPQVGQMVFFVIYTIDHKKNWWAVWVALFWFILDFGSDLQDRSNGHFLPLDGSDINLDIVTGASAVMTFWFYTVGSELFITASVAMIVTSFSDAVAQYVAIRNKVRLTLAKARQDMKDTNRKTAVAPPKVSRGPLSQADYEAYEREYGTRHSLDARNGRSQQGRHNK